MKGFLLWNRAAIPTRVTDSHSHLGLAFAKLTKLNTFMLHLHIIKHAYTAHIFISDNKINIREEKWKQNTIYFKNNTWKENNFIEDMITMKARKRVALVIKRALAMASGDFTFA